MKRFVFSLAMLFGAATVGQAGLISVSGPNSNAGGAAEIIAAPDFALDDKITANAMRGFDEKQNHLTSQVFDVDGGQIAAGTRVNSHMIFLNRAGSGTLTHGGVIWTFTNKILGVMSDSAGALEAASEELGNHPGTQYPDYTSGDTFTARGLESNNGTGLGTHDGYQIISPNQIRVSMRVTEPGDWIRVVTAVPEPSSMALFALSGLGLAGIRRRRR